MLPLRLIGPFPSRLSAVLKGQYVKKRLRPAQHVGGGDRGAVGCAVVMSGVMVDEPVQAKAAKPGGKVLVKQVEKVSSVADAA